MLLIVRLIIAIALIVVVLHPDTPIAGRILAGGALAGGALVVLPKAWRLYRSRR